jgi:hypothetical protein
MSSGRDDQLMFPAADLSDEPNTASVQSSAETSSAKASAAFQALTEIFANVKGAWPLSPVLAKLRLMLLLRPQQPNCMALPRSVVPGALSGCREQT